MRFLHTSDWHLGRLFHGVHLTEDQSYLLENLLALVADSRLDAVIIAGDIYDRAVPPPEAVSLLDEVLSRFLSLNVPVLIIAGNHDSPERLGFASKILARGNIFVSGCLTDAPQVVTLQDEHGPVSFAMLPYAEPAVVREKFACPEACDHNSSLARVIQSAKEQLSPRVRRVAVSHAFVAGGQECESERPLSVGGSGAVDSRLFDGFDYVALGHLHRAQRAGHEHIAYSGSLMKYSFSEADQKKGLNIVEMDGHGQVKIECVSLSVKRDVRRLEGYLDELLAQACSDNSNNDYLEITLLDKGAVIDPLAKLRAVYPNVLNLRRPALLGAIDAINKSADFRKVGDYELFENFYSFVTGNDLSEEEAGAYRKIVGNFHSRRREALV